MKRTIQLLLLSSCFLFFTQCDKTAEEESLPPYAETSLDATAGNWKTYLIGNPATQTVATPELATSAAYLAEVADLKSKMAAATAEQKDKALFWGGNAVLRWQEIARELAARHNLPPKDNPDGTYSVPDAANPNNLPKFPFANPPYASRAFAMLSVAQYDALVAAWHYKFQFNRLAPYKQDATVQPLIPASDLPSYPSEDAVIAAASSAILKQMFPGEKDYIDALAAEHIESRLWAGANVQSDLDAGKALGTAVATKVMDYSKTDGMKNANNQALVQTVLRDDATARGITQQWHSLDLPSRPPMLPFFGNVKPWNFSDSVKVAIRPAAPPAIGSAEFDKNLEELRGYTKNRTREQFRIAAFWADGPGTYTPPGHWNRKAAELIYEYQFNEIRSARAMALVNTAMEDAGISCWDTKYYYLLPRPTEVDGNIKTSTGIPNFPAYTSGHSTFSAAGAEVLSYLFPAEASTLQAWAKEASESRIYGCIHYRFDCETGLVVGKTVGSFAVLRGRSDGSE